jgi:hypothetical protein
LEYIVRFRVWNTSSHVILTADYINTAVFCIYKILAPHAAASMRSRRTRARAVAARTATTLAQNGHGTA